jgi:predicted transcriptional regulator
MQKQKSYTEEENQFLRESFEKFSTKQLGEKLGRTEASVARQLSRLDLHKKPKYPPYSKEEKEFINQSHTSSTAAEIAKKLNRTRASVLRQMAAMEIRKRPQWTYAEDKRLSFLWITTMSIKTLCKKFGRSQQAVCRRARALGLDTTIPEGYEFLSEAARRTGFSRQTLCNILRWAEVPIHQARSHLAEPRTKERTRTRKAYHKQYVDPFDVDEAVTNWMKEEEQKASPEQLAREHGLDGGTLRRRLRKKGLLGNIKEVGINGQKVKVSEVLQIIEELKKEIKQVRKRREKK